MLCNLNQLGKCRLEVTKQALNDYSNRITHYTDKILYIH